MAQKQRLTDAGVKRLAAPIVGMRIYGDEVAGFGLRVTAKNARSFILRYRTRGGRERTYTIGAADDWRTTAARAEAKRLRQLIDQGGDPQGDLQDERAAPTVLDLCKRFEAEHFPRVRPSTRTSYAHTIKNHVAPFFGPHVKAADVRYEDIDRLHAKLTAAGISYSANRAVAMLSKMFSLAVRWGMRSDNPCKGVERNYEAARKRYLSPDELARLAKALAEHPDKQAADIVRLLLLTGARKGEALAMRFADVDLTTGIWTKLAHTLKQKKDHIVPLSAPARALLADIEAEHRRLHPKRPLPTYVFPGRYGHDFRQNITKNWNALIKAADISGARIHDLRHSYASFGASLGGSLPLLGALLGHSNAATTSRYAHLLSDPQREMTERIGSFIENAGKPVPDNEVPLKRGGAS